MTLDAPPDAVETDDRPLRLAVVAPRYGAALGGGAESQAQGFAEEAVRRGWHCEVWTTCATDHYGWENSLPAGSSRERGVLVRRFPINSWAAERRATLEAKLAGDGRLPVAEQYDWLASGPRSDRLTAHVATHAAQFDAIVVLPYLMTMSYYAAWAALDKVVLWPCLHDESYAYFEPIRLLLESVGGVMFNSPEEGILAQTGLGMQLRRSAVLGEGVTLAPPPAGAATAGEPPYLLYIGRLEDGKNVPLLYEYVVRYVDSGGDITLRVGGRGPCLPPAHPAFDFLGFVHEREKAALYGGALALCQPSLNESFSLVMMEAWLAGRPALVHADCAVTRGHTQRSKAGLYFRTYHEFAGIVDWLRDNPAPATRMGANGRRYVQENYTWTAVADRFETIWRRWQQATP